MENKASNNEDYMESYVMDLILMDGTRAEDITAFSSREVLWPSGIVKDDYGTIDDRYFYPGDTEVARGIVGHIDLPTPVVNIRYMNKENPVLYKLIKELTEADIKELLYGASCAAFKKEDGSFVKLIDLDDYKEEKENYQILFGSEAIANLLKDCEEKDEIILTKIPVVPYYYRHNGTKSAEDLQSIYNQLLGKILYFKTFEGNFCNHYQEWGNRQVIQETVDSLIDNGGLGKISRDNHGLPLETLDELANFYMNTKRKEPGTYRYPVVMKKLRHLIVQLRDSDMEEELTPSTEIIEILKPLVDEIGKISFAESWEEYQEELRKCSFEALSFFLSDAAKKLSMGEVLASFTNCIFWNMEFYERKMILRKENNYSE